MYSKEIKVNWKNEESHLFLNPRIGFTQKEVLKSIDREYSKHSGHIWLTSSGTSSLKLVALSKNAFLSSAQEVNSHLEINPSDRWLVTLPHFHVGGLSTLARAHLSGLEICFVNYPNDKWDPLSFQKQIKDTRSTITSLVPTQLYDLCKLKAAAPESLRIALVGGDSVSADLYQQALELGWPVLITYGMTETCSQIATAELNSLSRPDFNSLPALKILPHLKVKTNDQGCLQLKGTSLLTGYVSLEEGKYAWHDTSGRNWYTTHDCVELKDGFLKPISRKDKIIKILGECVNIESLQSLVESIRHKRDLGGDCAIYPVPHGRKGHELHLLVTPELRFPDVLMREYEKTSLPFAKIAVVRTIKKIPRTYLGKIKYKDLKKIID